MNLHHQVENSYRLTIALVELMLGGQNVADCRLQSLVVPSLIVKPYRVQEMCIFQIAHRSKGDVHRSIYIVISFLHFGAQNSNDFKTETIKANVLAQCITSRKQFFLGF